MQCFSDVRFSDFACDVPHRLHAVLIALCLTSSSIFLHVSLFLFYEIDTPDSPAYAALFENLSNVGWILSFLLLNHWMWRVHATRLGKASTFLKLIGCFCFYSHSAATEVGHSIYTGYLVGGLCFLIANFIADYDLWVNRPSHADYSTINPLQCYKRFSKATVHANLVWYMMLSFTIGSALFTVGSSINFANRKNTSQSQLAKVCSHVGTFFFLLGALLFGFWGDFFDFWSDGSEKPKPAAPVDNSENMIVPQPSITKTTSRIIRSSLYEPARQCSFHIWERDSVESYRSATVTSV